MARNRRTNETWRRVFLLRRAIIPHIIYANGEGEDKRVCLTDDLDDVLFAALAKEQKLAAKRTVRKVSR